MYAQCPECLTVFSLDTEALAQAHGHALCGFCDARFDALATLTAQLPPEPFDILATHSVSGQPPRLELAIYRPRPAPAVVAEPAAVPGQDFGQLVFSPRFARSPQRKGARVRRLRRHGPRRWPWVAVCTMLALLLGGQLAWAKRDALISDPITGPGLRQTCAALGCRLPLVRDVDRLHLVARDVQSNPDAPGALTISATVRNDAAFAQPYPVVTLVLAQANGVRVAMRRLRPEEYLADEAVQARGLAPGASTAMVFEVRDPGAKAVAFEFGFE